MKAALVIAWLMFALLLWIGTRSVGIAIVGATFATMCCYGFAWSQDR